MDLESLKYSHIIVCLEGVMLFYFKWFYSSRYLNVNEETLGQYLLLEVGRAWCGASALTTSRISAQNDFSILASPFLILNQLVTNIRGEINPVC